MKRILPMMQLFAMVLPALMTIVPMQARIVSVDQTKSVAGSFFRGFAWRCRVVICLSFLPEYM